MKRSAITLIACLSACSILAYGEPEKLPTENIFTAVSQMMKDYRVWLAEKPRKLAVRFIEGKDLPDGVLKRGFKGAAIEDGFVILFSTDEHADPVKGIVVVTDGRDRSNLLRGFGWDISDSSDPRIRHLKRRKSQQLGSSDGGKSPN